MWESKVRSPTSCTDTAHCDHSVVKCGHGFACFDVRCCADLGTNARSSSGEGSHVAAHFDASFISEHTNHSSQQHSLSDGNVSCTINSVGSSQFSTSLSVAISIQSRAASDADVGYSINFDDAVASMADWTSQAEDIDTGASALPTATHRNQELAFSSKLPAQDVAISAACSKHAHQFDVAREAAELPTERQHAIMSHAPPAPQFLLPRHPHVHRCHCYHW